MEAEDLTGYCGALVSDSSLTTLKVTVDTENFGNSSVLDGIVPGDIGRSYQVEVPVISRIQVTSAINGSKFILKSDLQGYDACVLANFDDTFWRLCRGGVIEVTAHNQVNEVEIRSLLARLRKFRHVSWLPYNIGRVSDSEIFDFWTAGNRLERDLYFW
jgi:hypothetical protein